MASGVSLGDSDLDSRLEKSETLEKVSFEASVHEGVQAVFKKDDEFVIWGPASVEIVDKEGDKISVDALGKALPQLLRRARLSLDHSDQLVGRILERFETSEPVEIEVNGQRYERQEFPTDVLELDDGESPALYVAGEVYNDTQQSKRARERIEDGELTSYSISGEALVTRKKVDSGRVYDDVLDIDLSAVTLCEEGMNQGASYSKVEGEVSDKELAGEASSDEVSKREEVPVLQHPTMQGVSASEPQGSGAEQEPASVSKSDNMSDNPDDEESEGDAKSDEDGATVEDVLKRLPDEGEIATKDDLDEVEESAVKAVQDALPEGDLATTKYVDQLFEEKVEERVEQVIEEQSDEEEEDEEDDEEKGDYEDEEDEEDEDDKAGDEEPDVPDDDEDEEDGGDEMERLLQRLEEELPSDVWEVVREYVKGDVDESDIDFDGFGKSDEDEGDSVQDKVNEILKNGGSRAGSATTTPTADEEDQVEKQYESQGAEKSEGETGNPALAVWD